MKEKEEKQAFGGEGIKACNSRGFGDELRYGRKIGKHRGEGAETREETEEELESNLGKRFGSGTSVND